MLLTNLILLQLLRLLSVEIYRPFGEFLQSPNVKVPKILRKRFYLYVLVMLIYNVFLLMPFAPLLEFSHLFRYSICFLIYWQWSSKKRDEIPARHLIRIYRCWCWAGKRDLRLLRWPWKVIRSRSVIQGLYLFWMTSKLCVVAWGSYRCSSIKRVVFLSNWCQWAIWIDKSQCGESIVVLQWRTITRLFRRR